ncbi:uncharacterized protein [Centruroides vittatus]|uniref:uncharacterized protein n=1 Tax=Centruroides vittatus TaxID=120091 RepID=UPI00350EBBBE
MLRLCEKTRTPFIARKAAVNGQDGHKLHDQHAIKERWKEYTEQLYTSKTKVDTQGIEEKELTELEPDILEKEVTWALKQLASHKVPGVDGIPAELLKPLPLTVLTALCRSVWKNGNGQRIRKDLFLSSPYQRRVIPKIVPTTATLL